MNLVALRRELEARGWDCQVMNLNENRRVADPHYIDVQDGWDFFRKVIRHVRRGFALHVRCNAESKKGYLIAFAALVLARLWRRPALLTYCAGHQQTYFPAPRSTFRFWAFWLLFRLPTRIFCNSEAVKRVLLTTGIPAGCVVPIPHFSASYVDYQPVPLPEEVQEFLRRHDGVFFSYVCYRKEFELEFLAAAVHRFRKEFPHCGFLWVGSPNREIAATRDFVKAQGLEDAVCLLGAVPHDLFLTLISKSLAYIRTPMTDGICSSVLESLHLRVPVLASDNGTRPAGTLFYQQGDLEGLLELMRRAVTSHSSVVSSLPELAAEDNVKKLADSIEAVCAGNRDSVARTNGLDPIKP